jgi:hypothetical protein
MAVAALATAVHEHRSVRFEACRQHRQVMTTYNDAISGRLFASTF